MLKKTDYNTKIAETDTKASNLDGKIAQNKNVLEGTKEITLLLIGNIMFDAGDGSQAYLIFQPVHNYNNYNINII